MILKFKMRQESTKQGKITSGSRSRSRTPTTSKTQFPLTKVSVWKPLPIVAKNSISDTTQVLHSIQNNFQKKPALFRNQSTDFKCK